MPLRLQRASLIDQLCAALQEGLVRGDWPEWLPSERRLCADLHVGRNSLRAALRRLADEGVLEVVAGRGSRPTRQAPRQLPGEPQVIGLLSPLAMEQLRPRQALWIDELRGILAETGCRLRFVHSPQCFRANPAAALQRLIGEEKCGCWILVRSSRACQAWFERLQLPCVIAGSCHAGVDLPFVDLDYRAMCRHAATTLLQLGHRRIAFLTQRADAAGDLHSEAGFLEGVEKFPAAGTRGSVVHHGLDRESVARCVRRLMAGPQAPTALLINQSYHYLTVFSVLAGMGRRVPSDVSLMCRDEDQFLSYVEPEPARYVEDPHLFARKLARITAVLRRGRPESPPRVLLLPRLLKGSSVGQLTG